MVARKHRIKNTKTYAWKKGERRAMATYFAFARTKGKSSERWVKR